MRKISIILLSLCFILTSCGNRSEDETDKSIKYNGSKTVNIVLKQDYKLNVSSDESLTFYSDNESNVTVTPDGVIYGKNIGESNITISNSENEIKIHVVVTLFEEPTLDFGCDRNKILSLYNPDKLVYNTDSVIVYSNWYSYAVWSMSFFFENNEYFESDIYIRNDLDLRIDQYLNENFYYQETIKDNNDNEIYVYLDSATESDASVIVGKQYNANEDNDICLMYIPYTPESRNLIKQRH